MTIQHTETTLRATDSTSLFVQRWFPTGDAKAEVLVIHGYAEHSSRYQAFAHCLCRHGIAVTGVDLRGHGASSGKRGFVARFSDYHIDLEAGFAQMQAKKRFLLGHSTGGLIALDYLAAHNPRLVGAVVMSPLLDLPPQMPRIKLWLGAVAGSLAPGLNIPSDLDATYVSKDPEMVEAYRNDPLIFPTVNAAWFREVQRAWKRVSRLEKIEVPFLFAYGTADRIVSARANERFADRIVAQDKTVWRREGGYHELLNDIDRKQLHEEIAGWMLSKL